MLSVRLCPHCGAVCSTTGTLCAACGLDASGTANDATPVGQAQQGHGGLDQRPTAASRGVWQLVVDALVHGRLLGVLGRRQQQPDEDVREVMQTHVVEPAQRAALEAETKPKRMSNIA